MSNPTHQDALRDLVEGILASRGNYDGEHGRHTVANSVFIPVSGGSVVDPQRFYDIQIQTKLARAKIAAERGEVHWDSLLDLCGYMALLADWHSNKE